MKPPQLAVYLAAAFERQEAMREVASYLVANGMTVVSSWVGRDDLEPDHVTPAPVLADLARQAVAEICHADIFAVFTEPLGSAHQRGGRHVELGIALAKGMLVYVVGPRESMFHHHPHTVQVGNEVELVRSIRLLTYAIDNRREQAAAKES